MLKKVSNDCQDFGGAKEPKSEIFKNAATLLNSQLNPSLVDNEMIEFHPLNTNAALDSSLYPTNQPSNHILSRVFDKKESPKIQAGAKPRETLEGRLREQFNLPFDSIFEGERGEDIDMGVFDGKAHVPNTRAFSHVKFYNPKTGRTSNIYSCD